MDTVSTVVRTSTHEYSPGLLIDITRPPYTGDPMPVILWLHGGGWRMQDRTARPDLLQHFAIYGYVMASIDYRLTPGTRHPGQLYDVRAALRWLRRNAAALNADPHRIGLWGSSAGAHLAALAGLRANLAPLPSDGRGRVSPAVVAVVAGYGPADLTAAPAGSPEAGLLGGPAVERPAAARDASPALQVGPHAPPFLLLHGCADTLVPPTHSIALYDALRRHDNDAALYLIDGFGHGFLNPGDVLELGPGQLLDQGHLERDPHARASVRAGGPRLGAFAQRHPHASFSTIEAFFALTLKEQP
ncbi:alpha/beta hydrolase fold domain-containing protein [Mycobacterium sp. NPDC003323]